MRFVKKNIIFRNGYYALRNVYLARKSIELIESSKERGSGKGLKRAKFIKGGKIRLRMNIPNGILELWVRYWFR